MAARELPAVPSNMGLVEVASVFARYWPGGTPKREALALVLAQSALETGRWASMMDWNFGGVKASTKIDHTYFWTSECVTPAAAEKLVRESTATAPARMAKDQTKCEPGKVRVSVGPRHPLARFRAYESAEAGARDYLGLLSRRTQAWEVVNTTADAKAFVRAIKASGYFSGPEALYLSNVASMQREFLAKLPAEIPAIETIPPARLVLPSVAPSPQPSTPPAPARAGSRGYGDFLAFALIVGAAYVATSTFGGFRVPTVARAR